MNIEKIKDDKFLKDMNYKELNGVASDIRSFIVQNVSKTGGHLSSNLGSVETIMSLHKEFDLPKDKLLFDVGHQAYTHKILTGRADKFSTLRQFNGLSGFLDVNESEYDIFSSGHSSTSISTAMGMAKARDLNKENYEVIAYIGDGSIVNGVAFEALNNLAESNTKVIIILNDNDMAINKSVGAIARAFSRVRTSKSYAKAKSGFKKIFKWCPGFINFTRRIVHRLVLIFRSDNIFDNFDISYLGPVDGHNFKALHKAFVKAKKYPSSIVVHVKTKKGYGFKLTEDDMVGKYHGVAPFDLESGQVVAKMPDGYISLSKAYSNEIYDILKNDDTTFLISAAMVSGSNLDRCFNDFNDRSIDVGIAEEHAICYANGLAIANKKPIVSMYSTFMQRGYDEIVHDVARINSNVLFVVDRAGIVGKDGKTHQGVLDVSFVYPLENTVIAMPSNYSLIKPTINCLMNYNGPKFIRLQKQNVKITNSIENVEFGKFILDQFSKENKYSLIGVGTSYDIVKEYLINEKINLINALFIKPIDKELLDKIKDTTIIIYDNTSVFDGFCSEICKYLNKYNTKVIVYCIENNYIQHGEYNEVLKSLHLDEETIVEKVKELIYG